VTDMPGSPLPDGMTRQGASHCGANAASSQRESPDEGEDFGNGES
jgi:hypothetical protein